MFCKKGILRNFAKLSGKRLCQSLYFNKVAGLRPANLLKQRLWRRCFLENFAKFLRTPFFTEQLWWMLQYYLIHFSDYDCQNSFFSYFEVCLHKSLFDFCSYRSIQLIDSFDQSKIAFLNVFVMYELLFYLTVFLFMGAYLWSRQVFISWKLEYCKYKNTTQFFTFLYQTVYNLNKTFF